MRFSWSRPRRSSIAGRLRSAPANVDIEVRRFVEEDVIDVGNHVPVEREKKYSEMSRVITATLRRASSLEMRSGLPGIVRVAVASVGKGGMGWGGVGWPDSENVGL